MRRENEVLLGIGLEQPRDRAVAEVEHEARARVVVEKSPRSAALRATDPGVEPL
jgi:hypothetical protein